MGKLLAMIVLGVGLVYTLGRHMMEPDIERWFVSIAPFAFGAFLFLLFGIKGSPKNIVNFGSDDKQKADMNRLQEDVSAIREEMKTLRESLADITLTLNHSVPYALPKEEETATIERKEAE